MVIVPSRVQYSTVHPTRLFESWFSCFGEGEVLVKAAFGCWLFRAGGGSHSLGTAAPMFT